MSSSNKAQDWASPDREVGIQVTHDEHTGTEKHHHGPLPGVMGKASHLYQGMNAQSYLVAFPTKEQKREGAILLSDYYFLVQQTIRKTLLPNYKVWPPAQKVLTTFSVSYFIFLSYYITSSLNPILVEVAVHFDVSVTRASWLISFNVLFLGIGNLLWLPFSHKIGKRPVMLVSSAIFFASSIWCAVAKTYGSMLGARIVQGLGASSSEVLAPAVVADLFFLHERGFWVGCAMFNITFGSSLGGIFAGLVANATPNWRWVFWMNAILTGVCFLMAVLFSSETNFRRAPENEAGEGMHPDELVAIRARLNHSWLRTLRIGGWYNKEESMLWLLARPWLTLRWPAVVWGSLLIGLNLGAYVMQSTANSALFPELYHYSSLGVGNIAIGYLISGIFGCLAGGPLSDWLSAAITKHRGGYFLPEFRLWCIMIPGIFVPIGLLMWGGGLENRLSPFVAIIGSSISCGTTNAVVSTIIAYIVDCYRPFSGDTITIFTAFKNTVTFGLTFAVFPWVKESGPLKMSGYFASDPGRCFPPRHSNVQLRSASTAMVH